MFRPRNGPTFFHHHPELIEQSFCASQSATPASSAATHTPSIAYGRGNAPASTQLVRYCAPDDPDALDKAVTSPSVVYAAPFGDEEEEDGEGTTKYELTQASPVEDMLLQLQRRWETVVQLTLSERAGKLYSALEAADQTLSSQLAEIQQSVHQKQKELARADELQAAQQSHEREQRLLQLQHTHAQSARVQEQQVERLQQQAQQAAQRKRAEEAAVAAAAAEARAEQEAARAAAVAAAQAKQQEEAARAAAAAAAATMVGVAKCKAWAVACYESEA
ncbi:hypothetical protein HaLaN_21688 [Haematococcus lacustris]|uniref:Uncharacterized protein n=1 Tax=Haematococcus lacustris TaxID=44745 RepID=A0A699ZP34_HAELA|nr:hypothetical protein HaLaN_21688 [Haematococcus lacustris]